MEAEPIIIETDKTITVNDTVIIKTDQLESWEVNQFITEWLNHLIYIKEDIK